MNAQQTKQLKVLVTKIVSNPETYTRNTVSTMLAIAMSKQSKRLTSKDIDKVLASISSDTENGVILEGALTGLKFNYNKAIDTYKGLIRRESHYNKNSSNPYNTGLERWWGVDLSAISSIVDQINFPRDINILTIAVQERL